MRKLLCFLTSVLLLLGSAQAQSNCIDVTPSNIDAQANTTSTFNFSFANAGLDNNGRYALEYEFYLDGELISKEDFKNYVDITESALKNSRTPSVQIGSGLTTPAGYYPSSQFDLAENFSVHPLNYFNGQYLKASGCKFTMSVKWLESGNYTIKVYLVAMNGGTADLYMSYSVGAVKMGGSGATYGDRLQTITLTTAKECEARDTAVCFSALPVTIGDQTWTVSETWQDGGTDFDYITKTVTFYNPNSGACSPSVDSTCAITLRKMPDLSIALADKQHNLAICQNSTAGYIYINIGGGVPGYTIKAYKGGQLFSTQTCDNANTEFKYEGLAVGEYSFVAEDSKGCSKTLSGVTISEVNVASNFTVTMTATDIKCHDGADGAISTSVTAGTAGTDYFTPLTYAWSNSETTANVSDLAAGTYTLTVTDNKGCMATISPADGIVLANPAPITNTDAVTVCRNEVGNGYHYKNIDTINWTEGGVYNVVFESANGCDSTVTVTFTVNENPTATLSKDTAICAGGTAALTLEYTGALPIEAEINGEELTLTENTPSPYSFNVQPDATTTYTITSFVDANGCAIQANASSATVTVNTLPVVNSITTPDATACPFSESFSVSANVTAGSSDVLAYHWTGATEGETAGTATVAEVTTGQCGHEYELSVYVTDGNACQSNTKDASFTINDDTDPVIASTYPTIVDATANDCVFTIPNLKDTISPRVTEACGIDTIYQSPEAGTTMQAGDAAQTVTITVKDKCGNTATATISVRVPAVLKATVTSTQSYCYNTADGEIAVSIEGGKTPYSLQLDNETPVQTSESSYTFGNLADGTYSIAVTDANGCAIAQNLSATIEQIEGTLTVKANSDEKEFDGQPLTNSGYTVTFGESQQEATENGVTLLNGDIVTAAVSGTITNVGTQANTVTTVTVMRDETDVTCYYNIVKTNGTLTVKPSQMQVTCPTSEEATKKYDGQPLQPTATASITEGTTIQYSLDSTSWTTTAPSITNAGSQKVYVKAINANYDTAVCSYTLTINPRVVKLTSSSDSKTYDGSALTNSNVEVTEDGWADGEGATYNVTGSQLDAGSSQNTFTTTLNGNTLLDNYDTAMVFGTLTVDPITTPITITANTKSWKYDGARHTDDGYTYTQGVLVSGDVLTATVVGSITHVSTVDSSNIVVDYKVMRGETNVTGNYTFNNQVSGTLSILKRNVTLTSATDEKTYDGTALTNDTINVTGDDWANGEGATYTVTGTQTNYGASNNTFTYNLKENTTATDYNITPVYGTLTVNKLSGVTVTITGKRDTVVFDGAAHSISGFDTIVSSNLYTANCFVCDTNATASQTNVGTDFMELQSRHFRNVSNNFENVTFTVVRDGAMTITPSTMTVEATGHDAQYDGTSHSATVTPSITEGTTVYYKTSPAAEWTTIAPSITDFGTTTVYVKATNANYADAFDTCTLNVTKRDIYLTSATGSKEFDNTPLMKEEVDTDTEGDGFVGQEGLEYSNFASITNCGQVDNTFNYSLKANTKAINYNFVDTTYGTLTITKSDDMVVTCPGDAACTKKYDGTALNPSASVSGAVGTAATAIYYSTLTDNTWSDWSTTAPSITHVADGPKSVMVKAENANYLNDTCYYTLEVTKREVNLTTPSGSKTYDGTALTSTGFTVGGDGFATSEGVVPQITGKQLACGSSDNTFTYTWKDNTVASDYAIDTTFGTLTVNAYDGAVTITAGDSTKTYDGQPLTKVACTATGLLGNDKVANLVMADTSTITNVGTKGNAIVDYTIMNGDSNVTDCYTNKTLVEGLLTITKKNVTIISDDLSQEYNGDTLRNGSTALAVDTGWIGTDGVICTFTGEQVLVGQSANSFTYVANQGTDLDNYNINKQEGTLTVTDRTNEWEITIKSKSDTFTYDGNQHTVSGFDTLAFTFNDHIYHVSGVTASITKTSVGTYKNAITGTPVVSDAYQNDVTAQFAVTADTGNLVISKADFTLTCPTDDESTKTYDGTALNPAATASWEGGERVFKIEYNTGNGWSENVPSLTDIDTVEVSVRATNSYFNTQTCEYTLSITKTDSIVVTAKDSTITYNGQALTNAGYSVKFGENTYVVSAANAAQGATLPTGDVVVAVVEGTITNAGTQTNAITSVTVTSNSADKSGNYSEIRQHNGTLTVNKKAATLFSAGATKVYDGTELTKHEMSVDTGWINNEGVTITYTGTQTEPGKSENTYDYEPKAGTDLNNYILSTYNDTLTVTPSETAISISSPRGSWEYDGTDHTNRAYVVLEGNTTLTGSNYVYTMSTGDKITITPAESAHITNYAALGAVNDFSYTITNAQSEDVSSFYDTPTVVKDTLWITKKAVTLTSADSTKVYDGTPLVQNRVDVVGFIAGQGAICYVDGTITHAEDNEANNNTFTYDLLDGTISTNYTITPVYGTLTITPKTTKVYVKGHVDTVEYDGQQHLVRGFDFVSDTANLYSAADFQLVEGVSDSVKATERGTHSIGLNSNSFENINSDFANVVFEVTDGHLTILPGTMEVTCPDIAGTYNGNPYAPEATCDVTEGTTIYYSIDNGANWLTSAPSITHVAEGPKSVMVKAENANYKNDTCYYTLKLNPDTVTLVSAGGEKVYDGTALVNHNFTTNSGWIGNEEANVTVNWTGTQTEVGTSDNKFSLTFGEGTQQTDYHIDSTFGTLEVTALEGITVTITGKSDAKTYDGQAHTITGYTVTSIQLGGEDYDGYTAADFRYIGTAADTTVTATNVSDPAAAMTMTNAMFENTNDNFDEITFVVVPGTMTINPLAVTVDITGNTNSFTYDGEPHSVTGFTAVANPQVTPAYDVTNVALADGASAYAERTNAGETAMELTSGDFVNNDDNYNVTFNIANDGKVTINKATAIVTVIGNTNTVVYDGEEKSVHGFVATSSNPLYNVDSVAFVGTEADSTATGTNKGVYTTSWTADKFSNIDADFNVTFNPINQAVLTIKPDTIAVAITGTQVTAVYDAQSHSAQGWTAVATPSDHDLNLTTSISCTNTNATSGISRTDVDTTKMNLLANQFSCTDNNYYVTFSIAADGYVAIVPDTVLVKVTGHNATVDYNGTEQSVTGYDLACEDNLISLATDIDYAGDSIAKGTDVDTYDMGLIAADFSCNNDNFYVNFSIEEDGFITIEGTTVIVTVKGHSDTVVYDGASHQITGYDITSDVDSYTANIATLVQFNGTADDTIAHRTHVGDSLMTMSTAMFENTDDNYTVSFVVTPGNMTIKPYTDEVVVEIKGKRDTVEYNAQQQEITGYVATTTNTLYDVDNDIDFAGNANATGTDAATEPYWMALESSQFSNNNTDFTNVTFNVTDGHLKINEAPVTVKIVGDSAEYDFDGIEHTVTGYRIESISNPLYEASMFSFSSQADSTASRTEVGTTAMTMAGTNFTNNNDNFDVTFDVTPGALTINPIEVTVTITGRNAEFGWDGNAHTVTGYTATADNELYDVTNSFTFTCANAADTTATRTEAGTTFMNIEGNDNIVITNTNTNFTNVTFERVNGYVTVYPEFTADAPDSTIVAVKCNGENNGKAVVNIHGGKKPYTFAFTQGSTQTGDVAVTATDTTITMDTLAAGSYALTITDSLLGTANVTFTISEPEVLAAAQKRTEISCNGSVGADTLVITGGTAPYSVVWNGETAVTVADTFVAANLTVGEYAFTITDANGCEISEDNIEFTSPDAISASISGDEVNCYNSSSILTVIADGGTTPYSYTWYDGANEIANANESTYDIDTLTVGDHTVSVKVADENGCYLTVDHNVTINPTYATEETIYIPIGGSYEIEGATYHHGDDVDVTLSTVNNCDSVVTYMIRHYGLAIHFADSATVTQSSYLHAYNLDRTYQFPVDSASINANVSETKTFLTYFSNVDNTDTYNSDSVDMRYELYYEGELIADLDSYVDDWKISTYYDRTATYYGLPLHVSAGEIPANSFQLQLSSNSAIKYYDYFNYSAFVDIPNKIAITFNQAGTYTLKLKVEKRIGGGGTQWNGVYNPYIVNRRLGPTLGGYGSNPAERVTIAARDLDIVVGGSAPQADNEIAGISTYAQGSVSLYPNPVRDQLNLTLTGMEGATQITIVDAQGRTMVNASEDLTGDAVRTYNTSDYAQGVYFVYVRNNGQLLAQKFIVTK